MLNEEMKRALHTKDNYIRTSVDWNISSNSKIVNAAKVLEWAFKQILKLEKASDINPKESLGSLLTKPEIKNAVPEQIYKPLKKIVELRNRATHDTEKKITKEEHNDAIYSFKVFWDWFKKYCESKCYITPIKNKNEKKQLQTDKKIMSNIVRNFVSEKSHKSIMPR